MSLASWLNVRPQEVRPVTLSFWSAFLVIAFMILARSLRESVYITIFPVQTLPYVVAAVALLSVPAVGFFARQLSRHEPRRVLSALVVVLAAGLALLWPVATTVGAAVVAFYIWTALGTLLLTSGFWIVTAEYFPVRGAKRLYGLIGAGGTTGAMVMGNSISPLLDRLALSALVPGLILLLAAFLLVQARLPAHERLEAPAESAQPGRSTIREGLSLVWNTPHLRTIALIVASATMASELVDYQFKELARATLTTKEQLAGFFGAFYGWTGAIALIVQLLLAARLMAGPGIAITIAILPTFLLIGSTGLLLAPSLLVATLARGADTTLRKSLHRSVLEVLYVPLPSDLRRKTKTFVDSVVDAMADGLGAAIVFFWVTLNGLPSRYLSLFVMVIAGYFIYQSRRMGSRYRGTIADQLVEGGAPGPESVARLDQTAMMSATFTQVDIQSALADVGGETAQRPAEATGTGAAGGPGADSISRASDEEILRRLTSPDPHEIRAVFDEFHSWSEAHVPALTRLLAREGLSRGAISALVTLGDVATPHLAAELNDESGDFVIRRRIPRVFSRTGGLDADEALLETLTAGRFEIRYRAAAALVRRRQADLPDCGPDRSTVIWKAINAELARDRPVWELQRLLDDWGADEDLVGHRAEVRGELSLKHTFRLLSLVLDPEAVRAAYQGIVSENEQLLSLALEYLEQVLPDELGARLWPFIGDLTERQRAKQIRPIEQVVEELVDTGATLFTSEEERQALRRLLEEE